MPRLKGGNHFRTVAPINLAALHHEDRMLELHGILEGIGRRCDQVCIALRLNGPHLCSRTEQIRCVSRGGRERLGRRHVLHGDQAGAARTVGVGVGVGVGVDGRIARRR
jgi:hypothetical protein